MFLLAVQLKIFHCHLSMKKMAVANSSQAYFQKQQSIRQNTKTVWKYPFENFVLDGCFQTLGGLQNTKTARIYSLESFAFSECILALGVFAEHRNGLDIPVRKLRFRRVHPSLGCVYGGFWE